MLAKRIEEDTRWLEVRNHLWRNKTLYRNNFKQVCTRNYYISREKRNVLSRIESRFDFTIDPLRKTSVNQFYYFRLDLYRFEEHAHASKKNDDKKKEIEKLRMKINWNGVMNEITYKLSSS